jgi:hypothetical protein
LQEINENPSRGVFGVKESMSELLNGSVRTLILNGVTGEEVVECTACGWMACSRTSSCPLCGRELGTLPAEEGLIRAALRTDAEILFGDGENQPAFIGTAALLRY